MGKSSSEGHKPHTGSKLHLQGLISSLKEEGIVTGIEIYFNQEKARQTKAELGVSRERMTLGFVLVDPIDKMASKDKIKVDDPIAALKVTPMEIHLIQNITSGQRQSPICTSGNSKLLLAALGGYVIKDWLRCVYNDHF